MAEPICQDHSAFSVQTISALILVTWQARFWRDLLAAQLTALLLHETLASPTKTTPLQGASVQLSGQSPTVSVPFLCLCHANWRCCCWIVHTAPFFGQLQSFISKTVPFQRFLVDRWFSTDQLSSPRSPACLEFVHQQILLFLI